MYIKVKRRRKKAQKTRFYDPVVFLFKGVVWLFFVVFSFVVSKVKKLEIVKYFSFLKLFVYSAKFLVVAVLLCLVVLFWNIKEVLEWKPYLKKGMYNQAGSSKSMTYDDAIKDLIRYNAYSKLLDPLPVINIDVKHKNFVEISYARDKILDRGKRMKNYINIRGDEKKWFSASIRDKSDKEYKVKIRLKGDLIDHLDHPEKWSFKIKLKGGSTFHGMKAFSIQHPFTRNWLEDILLSEIMIANGILSAKYNFVKVFINGKSIGIMNLEPYFTKENLELNQRKESVVLRFSEDRHWNMWDMSSLLKVKHDMKRSDFSETFRYYYENIPIRAENHKKSNPVSQINKQNAISLMRGYMSKKIEGRDVFDEEIMAKYLAILHIFVREYYHGLEHTNARLYYNPITGKFEPVSNDNMNNMKDLDKQIVSPAYQYSEFIYSDKKFQKLFNNTVYDITKEIIETDKYDKIYELINSYYYTHLKTEFAYLKKLDIDKFKRRVAYVNGVYAKILNKPKIELDIEKKGSNGIEVVDSNKSGDSNDYLFRLLKWFYGFVDRVRKIERFDDNLSVDVPYLKSVRSQITIEDDYNIPKDESVDSLIFHNTDSVLDIYHIKDSKYVEINPAINRDVIITDLIARDLDSDRQEPLKIKRRLPVRVKGAEKEQYAQKPVKFYYKPPSFGEYEVIVKSKVVDVDRAFSNTAIEYFAPRSTTIVPTSTVREQGRQHAFLRLEGKNLIIKRGRWNVKDYIIVPQGFDLIIEKGAQLSFAANSGIISYGAVIAKATQDKPIIMKPSGQWWQGIIVFNARGKSYLENVKFYNMSGMQNGSWSVTGSVTFYKSDVYIKDTTIDNVSSEDALNIVHSEFVLDDMAITNTASDAFDSDFSKGKVIGGYFKDIGKRGGGDALDFSGSKVLIEGTNLDSINDKAISAGEASDIKAQKVTVKNSGHAFVAKDGSLLEVESSFVDSIIYCAIMSYQKKPIYGPSRLVASDISSLDDSDICARAQTGSRARVNYRIIREENFDVDLLYNTIMKKGKI